MNKPRFCTMCSDDGFKDILMSEYKPGKRWICPKCGAVAVKGHPHQSLWLWSRDMDVLERMIHEQEKLCGQTLDC